MRRPQLEHILRAAASITGAKEIVVIGSQALLGQFPEAPGELLASIEADLFTFRDPADADLIDGSIGEGSPFHQSHGYYAHGVGADTAVLPRGWRDRLVPVQVGGAGECTGLCLEIHDLAVAKLTAGRQRDMVFVAGLFCYRLAVSTVVAQRLSETPLDPERRTLAEKRLRETTNTI